MFPLVHLVNYDKNSFVIMFNFNVITAVGFILTHTSLASFSLDIDKQCKPDQTPQKAASDQVLHSLLTKVSLNFE